MDSNSENGFENYQYDQSSIRANLKRSEVARRLIMNTL